MLAFDHETNCCWLIASGHPEQTTALRYERAHARLDAFAALVGTPASTIPNESALTWRPTESRDAFRANVERVQSYIYAGDIYQANIAQRFVAAVPVGCDPLSLYDGLRTANPAPFGAYLAQGSPHGSLHLA